MNIVEKAYLLAIKYHEGQKYGIHDYTYHLSAVVSSLNRKYGEECSDVLLATAWLHDSLEDTMIPPQEIVDQCDMQVYDAVAALTKFAGYTYEYYISQVKRHPIALEVKLHDSLANLTASLMSGERGRILKYSRQMALLVGE